MLNLNKKKKILLFIFVLIILFFFLRWINFIEGFGTHIIFLAKKGGSKGDLQKIGKTVEKKLYNKKIPFFVDGDIE